MSTVVNMKDGKRQQDRMGEFSPSFIWQFSLPGRKSKEGQKDFSLGHGITEGIPQLSPVGKDYERNCSSKFEM